MALKQPAAGVDCVTGGFRFIVVPFPFRCCATDSHLTSWPFHFPWFKLDLRFHVVFLRRVILHPEKHFITIWLRQLCFCFLVYHHCLISARALWIPHRVDTSFPTAQYPEWLPSGELQIWEDTPQRFADRTQLPVSEVDPLPFSAFSGIARLKPFALCTHLTVHILHLVTDGQSLRVCSSFSTTHSPTAE